MDGSDFYLEVAVALSGCQLVEQELKLYITDAFSLASKAIGDRMTFKFRGDDYENSSLEGLIGVFRKLSANDELVRKLDAFKKERNFLSHQGIAYCLDYEGELAEHVVEEIRPRLEQIHRQSKLLRETLHEEANDFRGHLYFDDEELIDALKLAVGALRDAAESAKLPSGTQLGERVADQYASAAGTLSRALGRMKAEG